MMHRPQRTIIVAILSILAIGLLCLFSSCHQKGAFIKEGIFYKQVLWVGVGVCAMFLFSRLNYRSLRLIIVPGYVFTLVSLIVVLVSGRIIMGAQRWISLGEFSFQPSELGKFFLILVLAKYFSRRNVQDSVTGLRIGDFWKSFFLPLGIASIPMGLVLIQPDLGTAIVYGFVFFSVAYLANVRFRYLAGLAGIGLLLAPVFWHFLKGYQKSRLLVFLNPNIDPLGAGYTVIQSKIAIGSGHWFGKGWMAGTQSQLNFLAERHTDFIFSVIGEEWGFWGSLVLLVSYGVLIFMILRVAEMAKDMFGRLLCVGVASVICFHVLINLAMNVSFCPVVGLPLPFISYGGSSLVINLVGIGIVLNVARQK